MSREIPKENCDECGGNNRELRVIIAGSRDFCDYSLLCEKVSEIFDEINRSDSQKIVIISGHAIGTDRLGERYAADHGLQTVLFSAEWNKWGKSAGHIRNAEMAKYAVKSGGTLIVFWDGQSRGTANMIETAERYDLDVNIVRY